MDQNDNERAYAQTVLNTFRTGKATVATKDDAGRWHIQTLDGARETKPAQRKPWWKFW